MEELAIHSFRKGTVTPNLLIAPDGECHRNKGDNTTSKVLQPQSTPPGLPRHKLALLLLRLGGGG